MPLREDLLAAIPGENPSGVDLRYDPLIDLIREARREDLDLPQGVWAAPRKTADWPQVIRLTSEALATRSKDLRLAVWLTEALLRQEGVAGFRQGLELLLGLLEQYWDTLYPEIEDGDLDARFAQLEWIEQKLSEPLRLVPLNATGHTCLEYRESRLTAAENAGGDSGKQNRHEQAAAEGKLLPDAFDEAFTTTPRGWYVELIDELDLALHRLSTLEQAGEQHFGDDAPGYRKVRGALEELRQAAAELLARKGTAVAAAETSAAPFPKGDGEIPDETGVRTRGQPTPEAIWLDENVQFTVYRPKVVRPAEWYDLLAFAHLADRRADPAEGVPDPMQQVRELAAQRLGPRADEYRDTSSDSRQAVPREGEITLLPHVPGVEFNPERRVFRWVEDVHCEEFRLRASPALDGQTARGRLSVYLGTILLAEVDLAIMVDSRHPAGVRDGTREAHGARPYRRIFASYSRSDVEIVRQFESFAQTLGDQYLRDLVHLRAGEEWDEGLLRLIDAADVFQLFWSTNSMRSPFVRREWEYALSLGRPNFVRPTYWENPLPEANEDPPLPPESLRRLHFHRLVPEPPVEVPPPPRSDRIQQKLARVRAPRVRIDYPAEIGGATETRELAFMIGVLADLSGQPTEPLPGLRDRIFVEITPDNFDEVIAHTRPHLHLTVDNLLVDRADGGLLEVDLEFRCLEDFGPERVARQIGPLRDRLAYRARLIHHDGLMDADLSTREEGSHPFPEDGRVGHPPAIPERAAVWTRIRSIDEGISKQLNGILHHPDFQRLEATWRGLKYLLSQSEPGESMKIKVLDVSREELLRDLQQAPSFDRSAMFRKLCEEECGGIGRAPFGVLIGDYEFGRSVQDVELLETISRVAAATHAPFVTAASPETFNVESFTQLGAPGDLAGGFDTPEYARWNGFRAGQDSRYIALTCPRMLLREPYGKATVPVKAFDYEERVDGTDHDRYLWGNAAWALGARIAQAFSRHGWCAAIHGAESGGLVEGLPVHSFRTDSGVLAMTGPTEMPISERREKQLAELGFVPLVHRKGTEKAAFFIVQSAQKKVYDTSHATPDTRIPPPLPYILAVSRFAHYLKAIMCDGIGAATSRDEAERLLNDWIAGYVIASDDVSYAEKARHPLREARIEVAETPGRPGSYQAVAFLRPHFQLGDLGYPLRLVVDLPSATQQSE